MRKYFTMDGDIKKGPFSLDELKLEKINTNSPIWFEELDEWVAASELEELEEYFQVKKINNVYKGFAPLSSVIEKFDIVSGFALSLNNNKVGYRNSMSVSILVYGLLIISALIILSKS
jgi:hypothetical protein